MKILASLNYLFIAYVFIGLCSFSAFAYNSEIDSQVLLPLEGIYKLETHYTSSLATVKKKDLDRLIVMYSPTEKTLSLSISSFKSGQALIYFPDAEYAYDAENNTVSIHSEGVRGYQLYGELSLSFDLNTSQFSGSFFDSLSPGYKSLKGESLQTMKEMINSDSFRVNIPEDVTGVYQDLKGSESQMIVKKFHSGNYSALITNSRHTARIVFNQGSYNQSQGLLSFVKRNPRRGLYQKFFIFPEKTNDTNILRGFVFSTNGQVKSFHFQKVSEVVQPQ